MSTPSLLDLTISKRGAGPCRCEIDGGYGCVQTKRSIALIGQLDLDRPWRTEH
jgi:hypothetical protein